MAAMMAAVPSGVEALPSLRGTGSTRISSTTLLLTRLRPDWSEYRSPIFPDQDHDDDMVLQE
jgi:hypothetical protein